MKKYRSNDARYREPIFDHERIICSDSPNPIGCMSIEDKRAIRLWEQVPNGDGNPFRAEILGHGITLVLHELSLLEEWNLFKSYEHYKLL